MKIILNNIFKSNHNKNSEGFYSREGKLMNKIYKVIWSKVKQNINTLLFQNLPIVTENKAERQEKVCAAELRRW